MNTLTISGHFLFSEVWKAFQRSPKSLSSFVLVIPGTEDIILVSPHLLSSYVSFYQLSPTCYISSIWGFSLTHLPLTSLSMQNPLIWVLLMLSILISIRCIH